MMVSRLHPGEHHQHEMKPRDTREPAPRTRLYYLDWLRVLAVLGIFLAHTGDIFDTLFWHARQNGQWTSWNSLATFGAEWGMSLVFLLSGASAWFFLSSRTGRQFVAERIKRLLIPFVVAFLLLAPVQAYFLKYFLARAYSSYHGDLVQFFPYFFEHIRIGSDLTWLTIYGYHLWFLAFLFLISMTALPLLSYLKHGRGAHLVSRLAALCEKPAGLWVFVLPLAFIRITLWALFPGYQGWADFSSWWYIFVCGFILVADPAFQRAIRKQGKVSLFVALVCVLALLVANVGGLLSAWEAARSYSAGYLFYQLLLSITIWSLTVSTLYLAMRFLHAGNRVLRYANEAVLPFFILHEPVLVIIAFYVLAWNIPAPITYPLVSLAALLVILGLYEFLIRRIRVLRWLFGMKTTQVQSDVRPAFPRFPIA